MAGKLEKTREQAEQGAEEQQENTTENVNNIEQEYKRKGTDDKSE